MSFIFKNTQPEAITIYLEPSTDEVVLSTGDELTVIPKYDSNSDFEFHVGSNSIVIWIPSGQSATLLINGNKLDSFSEYFKW